MSIPSQINDNIVRGYKDYLIKREEVRDSTKDENLCCAKCLNYNIKRAKNWEDKEYSLNVDDYEKNPFFLGYKSKLFKGLLVEGKLLTEHTHTEQQLLRTTITTPIGKTCIPWNTDQT